MNQFLKPAIRPLIPFLALGALALAQPGNPNKVDICANAGGKKYVPISVSVNALEAHVAKGAVLQPNGIVPGSPGYVFDSKCNPVTWTYAVNTSPDLSATDPASPGNLYAGSGIPATNFGIARNAAEGVELGLMVLYRQGPTVASADDYNDGVLNFTVASGPQSTANGSFANVANRAAWNYTFSIATGLNGATTNLSDFTFELLYDVDPGPGVTYRTMTLEAEGTPQAAGQSGYQWRDQSSFVFIADDEGTANVTQNSQNYAFGQYQAQMPPVYGTGNNFAGPAKFDLTLRARKAGQIVASNHIAVNVNP
jgi:hypothetical protein